MKVSVIVPVFNRGKFLGKCVESILSQTFKDFELILVDDGSSDNSPKICDEYALKDERVKVLHKENAGVSAARNDGISMATGKYIAFVDSDDFLEEDFLYYAYEKIEETSSDLFVSGICNEYYDAGMHVSTKQMLFKEEKQTDIVRGSNCLKRDFLIIILLWLFRIPKHL